MQWREAPKSGAVTEAPLPTRPLGSPFIGSGQLAGAAREIHEEVAVRAELPLGMTGRDKTGGCPGYRCRRR